MASPNHHSSSLTNNNTSLAPSNSSNSSHDSHDSHDSRDSRNSPDSFDDFLRDVQRGNREMRSCLRPRDGFVYLQVRMVARGSSPSSPIKIEDSDDDDTVMMDLNAASAIPPVAVAPLVSVPPPVTVAQPLQNLVVRNSDVRYQFQQSLSGYPLLRPHPASPLPTALPLPAPKCLLSFFTSDDKLSCMWSKADDDCNYRAISIGDVFKIKGKEATLVRWERNQPMWFAVEGSSELVKASGTSKIAEAMGINNGGRFSWADVNVYRDDVHLGTLQEIRQSWSFRNQEFKYHGILTFTPTHQYRLSSEKEQDGYRVISHSGLYRKIRLSQYPLHNQALMLDFGHVLNTELRNLAAPGYDIVAVDMRILQNDGICARSASDRHMSDIYDQGPAAFSTAHCRRVAGGAGWSGGHASLGPLALAKGYNETQDGQWSRNRGKGGDTDSLTAFSRRAPNRFMVTSSVAVGNETAPPGVPWTEEEITRVTLWHLNNIQGRIIHDPIPVTRVRMLEIGQTQRQLPAQQIPAAANAPVLVAPAPSAPVAPVALIAPVAAPLAPASTASATASNFQS